MSYNCEPTSFIRRGGNFMRKFLTTLFLTIFIVSTISITFAETQGSAKTNITNSTTETSIVAESNTTATHAETHVQTKEQNFRVGPTVRLRPLNSEINKAADGIVEVFLNNPSLNDCTLEVDMAVDVPSDIYIYAEDGGMTGGAGTVTGHFTVPSGASRTIALHIKGGKVGTFPVHFSGMYWPGSNKDKWNPISLDNSFEVKEPSSNITKDSSNNQKDIGTLHEIPYSYILAALIVIIGIVLIIRRPKT